FLANLLLATAWVRGRLPFRPALVLALLVAAEVGYGVWSLHQPEPPDSKAIAVGVVQSERESLAVNGELTQALLRQHPGTRIVAWPEQSFSERPGDLEALRALAREHGIVLVAGCERPLPGGGYENVVYWVAPDGTVRVYRKRRRVPFVEFFAEAHDAAPCPCRPGATAVAAGAGPLFASELPRP